MVDNKIREVLYEVIDALIKWEEDLVNADIKIINKSIYRLTNLLLSRGYNKIPLNIPEFIIFLKEISLAEMGFNEKEVPNNLLEEKVIFNGSVNSVFKDWYEDIISLVEEEETAMLEFLNKCRLHRGKEDEEVYCNYYKLGRSLVNKENNIITNILYKKRILNDFPEELRISLVKWRKDISIDTDEITICPVCGKRLEFQFGEEGNCSDICNYYIKKNGLKFERLSIDTNKQYSEFTQGIYKYILLPNIGERVIYEKLLDLGELDLEYSPNMDEYDIRINVGSVEILVDVKDVSSPSCLVELLKKNNSIKKLEKNNGSTRFLVIPEHRRKIYLNSNNTDYKLELQNIFKNEAIDIEVLHEKQLYKIVKEAISYDY